MIYGFAPKLESKSDESRAFQCEALNKLRDKKILTRHERILVGTILYKMGFSLRHAERILRLQTDDRYANVRRMLKKVWNKGYELPRCYKMCISGLCRKPCGRVYPDLTKWYTALKELYGDAFQYPKIPKYDTNFLRAVRKYYRTQFQAPKDLEYKFRLFKIQTLKGFIRGTAHDADELTHKIREIAEKQTILNVHYSLRRFVSPKWADKDNHPILVDEQQIWVLDLDLHRSMLRYRFNYESQNRKLKGLLTSKMKFLKNSTLQKVVFSGGGFHFYLLCSKHEALEQALRTGADRSVFDDKRCFRLVNSLNTKYGDLRICKPVEGEFDIRNFLISFK